MGSLTGDQVAHFKEAGYVVVRDVVDPAKTLDPIIAEYEGVLDRLAHDLFDRGVLTSAYSDLPFGERFTRIVVDTGQTYAKHFDFSLPQKDVKADSPFWTGPAVFATLVDDGILDAVESLIGGEIYSNPVQHVRIKPPERYLTPDATTGRRERGTTQPHQDNGVVTHEADDTEMITVWFPLLDAPIEKGCLWVIPASHQEGVLPHCPAGTAKNKGGTAQIPEEYFDPTAAVALPMERGDILLVHRRTIHGSLPNVSDEIRWSFDLRYNPTGQPTGRSAFPGFVARSRSAPESELRDPREWARSWLEARARLAIHGTPAFNRWGTDDPLCA